MKQLELDEKAPLALCEELLDEDALNELDTHATLFARVACIGLGEKQLPHAQHSMLAGLELLLGKRCTHKLMPYTAHVLKKCYDLDILTEEYILEWGIFKYFNEISEFYSI